MQHSNSRNGEVSPEIQDVSERKVVGGIGHGGGEEGEEGRSDNHLSAFFSSLSTLDSPILDTWREREWMEREFFFFFLVPLVLSQIWSGEKSA